MGPNEQIAEAFGSGKSLYEILGVAKDATPAAIRKAYFKLALTCVSELCVCCCWCIGVLGWARLDAHLTPHTHPRARSTRTSARATPRPRRASRR